MRAIRRKEKAIRTTKEMQEILLQAKYITLAMCTNNEPYLVTVSHGYDKKQNCLYFHCAAEGKKIDILRKNNLVWGQALLDKGYVYGKCDHLYTTTQFKGRVEFITDLAEKKRALTLMIHQLEEESQREQVMTNQLTDKAIKDVTIGRIDIDFMSGKQAVKS
ncbi:MAG: pyridoxamine 5'-phosphate oxidase family protein [Candidatus Heimdallarchaeota archaeon]|nr:pyridoxamine 5'-phosphate oxidase family protein [Candidatus Heimdallarchaeota archaeon]